MHAKIGLTGGIASGKSTVAKYFADLGVPVIDADHIVHALTQPGQQAYQAIMTHMGEAICLADGSLNRVALRERMLSEPEVKAYLENLLHPLVREAILQQLNKQQAPYALAMIPLLTENQNFWLQQLDHIIVVDTPEALQFQRLMQRSGMTEPIAKALMQAQSSRDARLAIADICLLNDGSLEVLEKQVKGCHEKFKDERAINKVI